MEYNYLMQRVLNRVYMQGVNPAFEYKIWQKETLDGELFWGIADFGGWNTENVTQYGKELTELEWDGNELFFCGDDTEDLERQIIATYLGIKKQLEECFKNIEFDIVVSVNQEEKHGTIRFYAIREEYHYIEPTHDNIAKFEQEAILVDTVNQVHLEKYIPHIIARLEGYHCRIILNKDKELQIINPYQEVHIYIEWTNEFTMYFGNYHGHYGEEELEEMLGEIECILQGCWVQVTVTSEERWLGSSLWKKESLPLQAPRKLLKQLFLYSRELLKEVQKKGCVIELTGWNPADSEQIVIKKSTTPENGGQ